VQGALLPIGGLKQKVLAAHAAGLTDLVLPERNRGDLDDVPDDVREAEVGSTRRVTIGEVREVALEARRRERLTRRKHGGRSQRRPPAGAGALPETPVCMESWARGHAYPDVPCASR
jgi:predicted ATP-dependent protease